MGYLPEEEMSYKQTTAKAAAEAAALRDQYEVRTSQYVRSDLVIYEIETRSVMNGTMTRLRFVPGTK